MTYVIAEGSVTTKPTLHRGTRKDGKEFVVANFLLSSSDRFRDGGVWKTTYAEVYDVAVFGDMARRVHEILSPGDRVIAAGQVTKLNRSGGGASGDRDVDDQVPDTSFNRRLEADNVGISVRFLEEGQYTRRTPEK